MRLRTLAFATFLVWRLRIGACVFWRLWQLPISDRRVAKNCSHMQLCVSSLEFASPYPTVRLSDPTSHKRCTRFSGLDSGHGKPTCTFASTQHGAQLEMIYLIVRRFLSRTPAAHRCSWNCPKYCPLLECVQRLPSCHTGTVLGCYSLVSVWIKTLGWYILRDDMGLFLLIYSYLVLVDTRLYVGLTLFDITRLAVYYCSRRYSLILCWYLLIQVDIDIIYLNGNFHVIPSYTIVYKIGPLISSVYIFAS